MFENIERRRRRKPVWPWILLAVLILAVAALGVWHTVQDANEYTVWIELTGKSDVTVEYGGEFTDPGAEGWYQGKHYHHEEKALEAKRTGELDLTKLGDYTLTYTVEFEGITAAASRTVHVVDTVAPKIELTTDPEKFTLPGAEYVEEGFTATDNYDGDLTDKVQRVEENGVVTYTVSDSSGNTATLRRTIVYNDITAPTIELLGEASVTIIQGSSWSEPGYTATDDAEGDVTAKVAVEGSVDVNTPGTYTVVYKVEDNYGNATSAQRTVVVKELPPPPPPVEPDPPQSNPESSGEKVIYLTFDDGPSQHTARLLEVLAKYNVKATFFVCDTGYKSVLKDIAAGGHSLAIHSKSHDYNKIYASEDAFMADMLAIRDMILAETGVDTKLMRFPGGSSNSVSKFNPGIMTRLTKLVEEKGFHYFDWNVDSDDAGSAKTADEVYRNVVNGVKNRKNSIVLQHDIRGYSVDAVERIIQWGLQNGYTFKALDENSPTAHHGVRN